MLDNTREYLCQAVVTVVDHLGSVSANLDCCIQKSDRVTEAERRINCLKQVSNTKAKTMFTSSKISSPTFFLVLVYSALILRRINKSF